VARGREQRRYLLDRSPQRAETGPANPDSLGEMTEPKRTRVFISYSHDSDLHRRRVLELAQRLAADGLDCALRSV
jgi:hypothetical protein